MSILSVQNINTGYAKKQVLFDVSMDVERGETVLLIGSNGSGKSTLFKAIYGEIPLWNCEIQGKIFFNDEDITNEKSFRLINKGIMYIPQKNELFEDMTVDENLKMSILHLNERKESKKRLEEVLNKLDILKEKRKQIASKLSGGERKMVSLGMALMNRPKLLLWDEPLAGLSESNVKLVLKWVQNIINEGTTLFIIEHRIKEMLGLPDRVLGMKLGRLFEQELNNLETIKSFML